MSKINNDTKNKLREDKQKQDARYRKKMDEIDSNYQEKKEKIKESSKIAKEKHEQKMSDLKAERDLKNKEAEQQKIGRASQKPALSETEKFAKTGNFLIRGISLWFALPFIFIILFAILLLVMWVLDSVGII